MAFANTSFSGRKMSSASVSMLEALLHKFPDMKNIYDLLSLESITPKEHPEKASEMNRFIDPEILISIGILANCYIIQRGEKNRVYYIEISNEVTYNESNKGRLIDDVYETLIQQDYYPEPLSRKLVYITSYSDDGLEGLIYSKVRSGFILGNEDINARSQRVLRKSARELIRTIVNKMVTPEEREGYDEED